MRDPADARGIRAVSTLAHGAIELLLEAAQERPRLVTNDSHNCSPVGMLETKRKPCAVAQDVWLGRRGFKSRGFVAEARADPSKSGAGVSSPVGRLCRTCASSGHKI